MKWKNSEEKGEDDWDKQLNRHTGTCTEYCNTPRDL